MNNIPNEELFEKVRESYHLARKEQWNLLRDYFQTEGQIDGYKVRLKGNAGHGVLEYESSKEFENTYNLSNWRWIELNYNGPTEPKEFKETKCENPNILISLQEYSVSRDGWPLALADRIGVYLYCGKKDIQDVTKDAIKKMEDSEIELPLNQEDLEKLREFIIKKLAEYNK